MAICTIIKQNETAFFFRINIAVFQEGRRAWLHIWYVCLLPSSSTTMTQRLDDAGDVLAQLRFRSTLWRNFVVLRMHDTPLRYTAACGYDMTESKPTSGYLRCSTKDLTLWNFEG